MDDFNIEANGGSVATITSNKQLAVEANGGSIVNYNGDPASKNITTNGGAIVRKKSN